MSKKYRFTKKDIIAIQNFVDNIIEDIQVVKGFAYQCDLEEEMIFLGRKRINKYDNYFMEWLREQPEYTFEVNTIVISILHEIGHFMTYNEEISKQGTLLKGIYGFLQEENIIKKKEHNFRYFEIENEKLATMWGLDYYKNNRKQCDKLAEMLGCENVNLD